MPDLARERLDRRFFEVPPRILAPALLGRSLVRVLPNGVRLSGRIVEVEAYLGVKDRASHTFGGRRTPRNEAMYGRAGTAYVYFTYGMHFCVNVVCGEGEGVAVLLRALEPVEGIVEMIRVRRASMKREPTERDLCSGPARLCRAMGIDRSHNGADLVDGETLFLEAGEAVPDRYHARGRRVGVEYAKEWAARRLRWFIGCNPHVSTRA